MPLCWGLQSFLECPLTTPALTPVDHTQSPSSSPARGLWPLPGQPGPCLTLKWRRMGTKPQMRVWGPGGAPLGTAASVASQKRGREVVSGEGSLVCDQGGIPGQGAPVGTPGPRDPGPSWLSLTWSTWGPPCPRGIRRSSSTVRSWACGSTESHTLLAERPRVS